MYKYFLLLLLIAGCVMDEQSDNSTAMSILDTSTSEADPSVMKIYALPSPLQISTSLKNHGLKYNPALLPKADANGGTAPEQAMKIGAYLVDLGYVTLYEQRQEAINYLKVIKELSKNLGIGQQVSNELITKFQKNKEKPDSLYRIILEYSNQIHHTLLEQGRKDIGLLLITGCLIEGLYINAQLAQETQNDNTKVLLKEQEIFVGNMLILLQQERKEELQPIINQLQKISNEYEDIALLTADTTSAPSQIAYIPPRQMDDLLEALQEARAQILR